MFHSTMRIAAVLACGAWSAVATAQEAKDMHLEDAGFIMRPADTPEKLARLRKLPARTFVARNAAGGRYYIYADPDVCKCAFVGDGRAMQAFRDMRRTPQPDVVGPGGVSPENQIIRDMDADMGDVPDGDILDFRFQ